MTIRDLVDEPVGVAHPLAVPLVADSVASPRLAYASLDLAAPDGAGQAYDALYFQVAGSAGLGRVTFEGLDAVRGARGEYMPYDVARQGPGDWVFVVVGAGWLSERHAYEMRHYATSLSQTHRHYLFAFHDEFVEVIAEGMWFDLAERNDPFARPAWHPLNPLPQELPADRFTSADGLTWQLRRSTRADADLVDASRYCSQRVYQFDLVLDGVGREAASIWIRTQNGVLVSSFRRQWPVGEVARMEGFADPSDFAEHWETYLAEVAQRRRQMGK